MTEQNGRAVRDISQLVDISVRKVGDTAATSDDGNWDAAEATLTSAFTSLPDRRARSDVDAGAERAELFAAHRAAGRWADAVTVAEEIVADHRRYYGRHHYRTVGWTVRCGEAHLRAGDPGRAEPLLRFALTALESLRGDTDPETGQCRRLHGAALRGVSQ
ncbi:tetratricopeptide repeat protein [Actinoplanes sp. NPDC051411]|uniref:tetratricopeptide repeat protein n=1 Tax=Actinoplanes sp. NPDC051411 TaxID=3155522 RepID=UPI00342D3434